jgi:hypothetical protein
MEVRSSRPLRCLAAGVVIAVGGAARAEPPPEPHRDEFDVMNVALEMPALVMDVVETVPVHVGVELCG